ncbi:MAG: efflux RND transporter periplasmic adaptor subunit, partial [Hymenobacteraceae bacterium]|nr:efflux RND transporter periplasmic adaptor subunit [Hymenobacteraceae bacterium]MDX5395299.1 efflux RND transporter periplasmic adaptor subunit [Hymenobacteraceae bacterium]MDX5511335.1 efflux RND transporter periplasmic adaptor subunit [Hymenobacteraceae bacterium]
MAVALGGLFLGWLLFADKKPELKDAVTTEEAAQAIEYTCSMHPQIRQNEPGNCPICGMELIPVSKTGSTAAEADPFVLEMTPEAVALANIQTTVVGQTTQENELFLSGKVEVNEQKVSSVTAKFPGRIERLYVDFTGQPVQKGQRLASMYSPELLAAQRELQEAAKNKNLIPELYEAAKNKLRLWKLSDRQIQQIENSEKLLTTFDIYADVSGVVTQKLVSVGDYISTGSVLFEVANLNEVWVVLDAYETDLSQIKVGSDVSFTVPSAPGKTFTGEVE